MKINLDAIQPERELRRCSRLESLMRHELCYHSDNPAEVAAYMELVRRWNMTHSQKKFDSEWMQVAWLLSGQRGCRQLVNFMEKQPRWIYGGWNAHRWHCRTAPSLRIDDSRSFQGAVFDHIRMFRNDDGTRRLLTCIDYLPDDRGKLREMADAYGLRYREIEYDDRWLISCIANFDLD